MVSGTRADYGLLKPLMNSIRDSQQLELQLVVTGSHLSEVHGSTVTEIENDGFSIDSRVPILSEADHELAIAGALGSAVSGIAAALDALAPDIVVVLGDRYEALAAGVAATVLRRPIAHIQGGESTTGVIDEAFRHSLSKMAHLHFASAEPYRNRIIQLGENPEHVWCTGALGLDGVDQLVAMPKERLASELDLEFGHRNFLITYHPVTLQPRQAAEQVRQLVSSLKQYTEAHFFVTMPNAEIESSEIREVFLELQSNDPRRTYCFASLGQTRYLSMMKVCDVVIGNSSSGIIEAPSLGTPTVNIGDRQKGRLRGESVFDVEAKAHAIERGICQALRFGKEHPRGPYTSPYGVPGASGKIRQILESFDARNLLTKEFHDLA